MPLVATLKVEINMSNSKTVEKITHALAGAIKTSAEIIIRDHPELTAQEAFEIKVKATTSALLAICESSKFSPVQLATGPSSWLAIGQVNVGGGGAGAISTKALLDSLQNKVLKHESCNCASCQTKVDIDQVKSDLDAFFEPNVNEQTAQEILKEIESETTH